jgi:Skp family chaperone for outer membrane proteins
VKRTVAFAAGALTFALAGVFGSHASAQQPATATQTRPAAAEPRTRIALLNLGYVIKNYKKFETFQSEIKAEYKNYEARVQAKQAQSEQLTKHATDPKTAPEQRDADERTLKQLKREIEDLAAEAKAALNKKQDEQLVILYREIQDAASRYAMAHNFEAVFHYQDATTQQDYYNPYMIARKVQSPSLMPIYQAPGLDISYEIVMALNAAYLNNNKQPAAGQPAPRPAGN